MATRSSASKPSLVTGKRSISTYVSPEDEEAIEQIKARTGLSTAADAVRLAIRLVAHASVGVRLQALEDEAVREVQSEARAGKSPP